MSVDLGEWEGGFVVENGGEVVDGVEERYHVRYGGDEAHGHLSKDGFRDVAT